MRKKITLLLTFLLAGLFIANAQDFITVSGYVTNDSTGTPVAGHEVNITADSSFASTVLTSEAGFYVDTLTPNSTYGFIYITTTDLCTGAILDTLVYDPTQASSIQADFEICVGGGTECDAHFIYRADSTNPYKINFTDMSQPAGSIDSWQWEFGDGTGSSEQNPTHTYNSPGTYEVCLTIESTTNGCSDTRCGEVLVTASGNCVADFDYVVDSTYIVSFFDQSIPAEQIDSWQWDFGDGNNSSEQNPVHTYNAPGTYNVCLSVHADLGEDTCVSTYCMDVEVQGGSQTYNLGGNTFAGIYQLDEGFAYAYKMQDGNYTEVYSQLLDTLGYYLFFPLTEAEFYTKAEPTPNSAYYDDFLPTYYGDATHWEDAEMISLNQNVFNADINLVHITQLSCPSGSRGCERRPAQSHQNSFDHDSPPCVTDSIIS